VEIETGERPHRTLEDRYYLRDGSTKREATREELSILYHEAFTTRFEQVPSFIRGLSLTSRNHSFGAMFERQPGYWGESSRGFPTDVALADMGLATSSAKRTCHSSRDCCSLEATTINEVFPELKCTHSLRWCGSSATRDRADRGAGQSVDASRWIVELHQEVRRSLGEPLFRRATNGQTDEAAPVIEPFERGRANYSRRAVIECLLNFLSHRDWSARDEPARINIYDDAIEWINPAVRSELPMTSLRYGVASP
jgi:hypothetical protein